jgi:hypothetical protein
MDIDDLWFVDQRHPMYHAIKMNKVGEMKIDMLKTVDYVSTTTSIFAKTIKDKLNLKNDNYNDCIVVFTKINYLCLFRFGYWPMISFWRQALD